MRFRKKPVVVEAEQFIISKSTVLPLGVWIECGELTCQYDGDPHVHTLEGSLFVSDKDWVIKGIKGEFYPCKPDIFEATYERIKDE